MPELRILLEAWNHGYHVLNHVASDLRGMGAHVTWYDTEFDQDWGYCYAVVASMLPETAIKAGIPANIINALVSADWAVYARAPAHGDAPWEVTDRGGDRIEYVDAPSVGAARDDTEHIFGPSRGSAPLITSIRKMRA